jgi:soluble lytic murein transglycosylase
MGKRKTGRGLLRRTEKLTVNSRTRRSRSLVLAALSWLIAILVWWGYEHWKEQRFDEIIAVAALRYQLDPALIKAVIWRESRFHPRVRGRAGELGLMQIRAAAAMEWAAAERLPAFEHAACLDPATNIMAGSWYLKKALGRYARTDNPTPFALADYNAGRGNVLRWQTGAAATNSTAFIDQIQFPTSRDYVRAILRRAERYRRQGDFKSEIKS